MSRDETPPVPPLGDAALERIERGIFAALDARAVRPDDAPAPGKRFLGFALTGALALGSLAAFAALGVREWRGAEAPPARTELSTTTSGSHIAIAGAVLDVAPRSAVSFATGRDGAVVVVLERGTVTCDVAPRSKRAPFVVQAGATRVTVIGTRFSVQRLGDHATVSVQHGLVEVADTDLTELVHAGERFHPGQPVTREPLASETPAPLADVTPALPAPVAATTRAPVAPHARNAHPRSVALNTVAEPPAPAPTETPAPAAPAPAVDEKPSAANPEAAVPEGPRARSVQVLFELAAQLEVRDPEAALRIYGELGAAEGTEGSSGWAASALFAGARLEAERGQPARARALCESYLRRFPRGPNADDARALLATTR